MASRAKCHTTSSHARLRPDVHIRRRSGWWKSHYQLLGVKMRRAPETNGTMRAVTDWLSSHKALKCKLFISIAAICKLLKPKTNCHPVETGRPTRKLFQVPFWSLFDLEDSHIHIHTHTLDIMVKNDSADGMTFFLFLFSW